MLCFLKRRTWCLHSWSTSDTTQVNFRYRHRNIFKVVTSTKKTSLSDMRNLSTVNTAVFASLWKRRARSQFTVRTRLTSVDCCYSRHSDRYFFREWGFLSRSHFAVWWKFVAAFSGTRGSLTITMSHLFRTQIAFIFRAPKECMRSGLSSLWITLISRRIVDGWCDIWRTMFIFSPAGQSW